MIRHNSMGIGEYLTLQYPLILRRSDSHNLANPREQQYD